MTNSHCTARSSALPANELLLAEQLNQHCYCRSLAKPELAALLRQLAPQHAQQISDLLEQNCPHLFAELPVYIPQSQAQRMQQVITALDSVIQLPAYQQHVLANLREPAWSQPPVNHGVFYGYDFHLHGEQLSLIEINTNAGGAFLNILLALAQQEDCSIWLAQASLPNLAQAYRHSIIDMFVEEWQTQFGEGRPRHIVIVDENPEQQYLYPEFLLFQDWFQQQGWQASICAPEQLTYRDGRLCLGSATVDLVYNRLTDFDLSTPASLAIRQAWQAQAIVLTPNPYHHALYADKRNLVYLSDDQLLQDWGVDASTRALLSQHVPPTVLLGAHNADELWARRKQLFFKPLAGYGGKATYRGDKITQKVWQAILQGDYIAQQIAQPGQRRNQADTELAAHKFDLRSYVYQAQMQWLAARSYQGQTTNFRTPGGGFAPVYQVSMASALCD